jgi:hypothetical protein
MTAFEIDPKCVSWIKTQLPANSVVQYGAGATVRPARRGQWFVSLKVKKKLSDKKFVPVKALHSRNDNSPYENEAAA